MKRMLWFVLTMAAAVLMLHGCNGNHQGAVGSSSAVKVESLKPQALEILRGALRHENPYLRNHAIEVAAETGQRDLMAEIIRLMDDEAIAVRFGAVVAAGDMQCFGCEQDIRKRLNDEDENVQIAAAYSLTRLNYRDHYTALRQAVRDEDPTVAANAVLLLGKAGDPEDIPLLYQVMRDQNAQDRVKFQAVESLARLKDNRLYRGKLWALLISKYADDRVMGIRGMGALGTEDAKNAIITMLNNDDILEIRLCAAEQLGRLGNRMGHQEVADYLASAGRLDEPTMANQLAVMAIGRIGTSDLTAYLPKAMNSPSYLIRLTAAQSVLLLAKPSF